MKFKLNHKLKSSSLIEVLIAMIILLVVFGIGLMIFTNIVRSGKSDTSHKIEQKLLFLAQQFNVADISQETQDEDALYRMSADTIPILTDRIKIKVWAIHKDDGQILDSLVLIKQVQDVE